MADAEPARATFSQRGGDPVLDLVNTVVWRRDPDRRADQLRDADDLLRWCVQLGVLSSSDADVLRREATAHPVVADRELAAVRELREELHDVLLAGAAPAATTTAYRDAMLAGELRPGPARFRWVWDVDLALPRHRIALAAVGLLSREGRPPVRECEDDACGWVFLDTSPRGTRRWCDSADCGNRNRVRRFQERARSRRGGDDPAVGARSSGTRTPA